MVVALWVIRLLLMCEELPRKGVRVGSKVLFGGYANC